MRLMNNLNICLHDIVARDSDIKSIYDITTDQLMELTDLLHKNKGDKYSKFTLYFDDGHKSFLDIVSNLDFGISTQRVRCAVIVNCLERSEKLTNSDLKDLAAKGYGIDSHGMSHVALAVYREGIIQQTPPGGIYTNAPRGQDSLLSSEQVFFQLQESKDCLEEILEKDIDDFVLPYGLYNQQVIQIIISQTNYKRIFTCHSAVDIGQILAPRLLITQENLKQINNILTNISISHQLLTESQVA